MRRVILGVIGSLAVTIAAAQQTSQTAPTFAPVTLDEQSYNALVNNLAELKYKDAAAAILYLVQLEQKAQAAAATASGAVAQAKPPQK